MMRRTCRFSLSLAIVAMLALAGCDSGHTGRHRPPPEVGIVTIHAHPVTLTANLPGRTVPYRISDVRPQVSGIIKKRLFTEGAEVKAGQTLYQIDPKPYQAAYDKAKAVLASARASVATDQAKEKRYAALLKENAIARQSYDDARAAYQQAQAAVAQAKAGLETARINLGYTKVTAPITGRAGISNVTEGALVTADQTAALTTVQTLNPIYVNIAQSSSQMLALKQAVAQGQLQRSAPVIAAVKLTLDDGTRYPQTGKLQFADVTVNPNTGAVTLRALFPNPNHLLLPGMYVTAKIAEGVDPHAILAPQQGVSRNTKGKPVALVVTKAGKVAIRNLTVARAVGSNWLVTAGLKSGDRLIVQGSQKVRPGMTVHAVPVNLAGGTGGKAKADKAKGGTAKPPGH